MSSGERFLKRKTEEISITEEHLNTAVELYLKSLSMLNDKDEILFITTGGLSDRPVHVNYITNGGATN